MEGQAGDRLGLTGRGWWICRIGHLDFFTAIQAHLVQVRDRSAQQSFRGLVIAAQDNAANFLHTGLQWYGFILIPGGIGLGGGVRRAASQHQ